MKKNGLHHKILRIVRREKIHKTWKPRKNSGLKSIEAYRKPVTGRLETQMTTENYLKRALAYHRAARKGLARTMRTYIKVPIKILTPKLAQNKQDSFFYAGKNIAEVKILNRTYVLTTAGEYALSLKVGGKTIVLETINRAKATHTMTDAKIKKLGQKDLISNWGWFGINVWQDRPGTLSAPGQRQCLPDPTEVWSEYDEAMKAFIEYVEKDLKG